MDEGRSEGKVARLRNTTDLAIDLRDYGMLQRGFTEFDFADVHRVVAALNHVVELATTSSLRGGLPVWIVKDDIVWADAELGPDGSPVFQDQVLELQAKNALAAGR